RPGGPSRAWICGFVDGLLTETAQGAPIRGRARRWSRGAPFLHRPDLLDQPFRPDLALEGQVHVLEERAERLRIRLRDRDALGLEDRVALGVDLLTGRRHRRAAGLRRLEEDGPLLIGEGIPQLVVDV